MCFTVMIFSKQIIPSNFSVRHKMIDFPNDRKLKQHHSEFHR